MKLSIKLLVIYVISGLLLFAAIAYYAEVYLKRASLQTIQERIVAQLYQLDFTISNFLALVEYDVEAFAANSVVRTRAEADFTTFLNADEQTFAYRIGPTEQAIIDLFNTYRLTHPYVNSVYMGRENGSFVRSHPRSRPTQYDPRERPWYQIAVAHPERVMRTEPYQSVTADDVNIGTVKALVDERNQIFGVVGIDVTLRNLTDYITGIKIGTNGYILVLDEHDVVLAHQDKTLLFKTYQPAEMNAVSQHLFQYTSPRLAWKICAVVPQEEIDRETSQFARRIISTLAAAFMLLSVLTTIGVRHFIVHPIQILQHSTEQIIRTGRLDHLVPIVSQDEIGRLAASFNAMLLELKIRADALRHAHDELEQRVIERTAELATANERLTQEVAERKLTANALQQKNRELFLLHRIGQMFSSSLDLTSVIDRVLEEIQSLVGAFSLSVWLITPDHEELICLQAKGEGSELIERRGLKMGEGITGWVARHGESLLIQDIQADERHRNFVDAPPGVMLHAMVSLPLQLKGATIGVLNLVDPRVGHFTENERMLLEPIAAAAVIAIENARLYTSAQQEIAERKRAEDALQHEKSRVEQANHELEQALTDLKTAQAQLIQSEKLAALGQLVAGIAHEINTPLGAINASVNNILTSFNNVMATLPDFIAALSQTPERLQLLTTLIARANPSLSELSSREKRPVKRQLETQLTQAQIDKVTTVADLLMYLQIYDQLDELLPLLKPEGALFILQAARNFVSVEKNSHHIALAVDRAAKIVFALKKFAHQDPTAEKVVADILDGIETVLTLYYNQIKHGVEVIKQFQPVPPIRCYADELNQVWTNLIHNALHAMELKGTLTIAAERHDDLIVVSISDTGCGIPEEVKARIFEPFFTTKKAGEGCGLGLSIVKEIVLKHQGRIEFESEIGKGTTFRVFLPILE
jgi:two-component system NtrC family sensor kinase